MTKNIHWLNFAALAVVFVLLVGATLNFSALKPAIKFILDSDITRAIICVSVFLGYVCREIRKFNSKKPEWQMDLIQGFFHDCLGHILAVNTCILFINAVFIHYFYNQNILLSITSFDWISIAVMSLSFLVHILLKTWQGLKNVVVKNNEAGSD